MEKSQNSRQNLLNMKSAMKAWYGSSKEDFSFPTFLLKELAAMTELIPGKQGFMFTLVNNGNSG